MSTRCSIAYSSNPEHDFHFYHECFDDENVYLELSGPDLEYEAHRGCVTVRIPLEIWEVIRHRGGADLEYAGWTDAQIQTYVEQKVDGRIAEYQQHLMETGQEKSILSICGAMVWGMADEPREKQIQNGLFYCKRVRDEQTEIKRRIDAIEAEMKG